LLTRTLEKHAYSAEADIHLFQSSGAEFTFNPKPLGVRTTRGQKQLSTITERNSNDNDKKMCNNQKAKKHHPCSVHHAASK
jgi:hypothetical protein